MDIATSFMPLLQVFTAATTEPTAESFRQLIAGWIFAPRRNIVWNWGHPSSMAPESGRQVAHIPSTLPIRPTLDENQTIGHRLRSK